MTQVKLDTDPTLAHRLVMSAIRLTRTLTALTRGGPVSGAEAQALAVIVFGGRTTARALAAHQEVTPATISRLIAALETKGMIRRITDPSDGRVQWIEATDEGSSVLLAEHDRRLGPLAKVLADLPPPEQAKAASAIETLEDVVGRLGK